MPQEITRRDLMKGSVAAACAAFAQHALPRFGFAELKDGEQLIPFVDPQPMDPKRPMVEWQNLESWITPDDEIFAVSHYGMVDVDMSDWHLEVDGLVERPKRFTLDEIKARPRQEHIATLECSGNGASPKFMGAIANARWTGTRLAPLLEECGVKPEGIEVVFFGSDENVETIRDAQYKQNFARSLSLDKALGEHVLLCYELNGEPLSKRNGYPLRLVVPGWYGIAWVKWLSRIEVNDRRYMSKFMGREYVTIRGEQRGDKIIWRETSVGRMNLKSLVARVVRRPDKSLRISGAAWTNGNRAPIKAVELKIDDGPWLATRLDDDHVAKYAWRFWSYDWNDAPAGEHTLVSRAIDADGNIQPSADDPVIKLKKTYWEANEQYPRRIEVRDS